MVATMKNWHPRNLTNRSNKNGNWPDFRFKLTHSRTFHCIRQVLLYGAEVRVTRKNEERLLETTEEVGMLWRIRVTLRNRQGSEEIGYKLGVDDMTSKVRQAKLRWLQLLKRIDRRNPIKETSNMEVRDTRPTGRLCTRGMTSKMTWDGSEWERRMPWNSTHIHTQVLLTIDLHVLLCQWEPWLVDTVSFSWPVSVAPLHNTSFKGDL